MKLMGGINVMIHHLCPPSHDSEIKEMIIIDE